MNHTTSKLPRIFFGVIILCFLLPFVNVSCSGQKVMSITGIQMVTGVSFQEPGQFGENAASSKAKVEPLAAIVLFIAAFGFLFLLVPSLYFKIWDFILSISGASLLLVLKEKIDDDLASQGGREFSGITVNYDIGFWLAFILFVAIFVVSLTTRSTIAAREDAERA